MSEVNNHLFDTIDRQNSHESAHTRRRLIATTGAALGSMGLLGFAGADAFGAVKTADANSVETLSAVAATAEVLATIVNTVGPEKLGDRLDAVTARNIRAAAQQEKNHYELLTSSAVGGKAVTTTIYVPDEVFASPENLLTTLVVGDQVFINAYLLATTVFARQGTLSRLEVRPLRRRDHGHRGRPPRPRAAVAGQARQRPRLREVRPARGRRRPADDRRRRASTGSSTPSTILESAGFGFGKPGSKPGTAYDYATVSARTPTDPDVNTIAIS